MLVTAMYSGSSRVEDGGVVGHVGKERWKGGGRERQGDKHSCNLETRGLEGDGWLVDDGEEGSLIPGDIEGESNVLG